MRLTWDLKTKTETEGKKKVLQANGKKNKAGVAILLPDKIDFKTKTIKRDKEGHYIMIKGSIQLKDITILNMYASNKGAPKYIKQILTNVKKEPDSNTIIAGDFNVSLTSMDRSSRKKINKETLALNNTLD